MNDTEGEKELIAQVVDGNEQAFSVLFFKYLPVLNSFATKFTKSSENAKEIIQDAFVRIWLNRDKLKNVDNVKAYLYKYVANECLGYIRKKGKEERLIGKIKTVPLINPNSTYETITLNEIKRIVANSVEKLPEQRKKIYVLSRNEGKTIPEIAEILSISPNTVKNALVSALKTLRQDLFYHGITFVYMIFLFIF